MKKLTKKLVMLTVWGLSMGAVNAQTWNIGTPTATDVTATLSGGTLTISGSGAMQNFSTGNAPWYSIRSTITALVIQNGVTNIGDGTFFGCSSITSNLTIPNSVTAIGYAVFKNCSGFTGNLTIPDSVTFIDNEAFSSCSGFTGQLTIPHLVSSIGGYAFTGCIGFTSLIIPNSVTSLGESAFSYFNGLSVVTCLNPDPSAITLGGQIFWGINATAILLRVPCVSVAAYHTAAQWSDFTNSEGLPLSILAMAGTDGTISPMGAIAVNCADSQTFTFTANSGYEISQVLIDGVNDASAVTAGTYTFTNVSANHKIEVYFKPTVGIVGAGHALPLPRIYPNPTTGQLRVSGDILDGKDREIRIFNVVGQVVFTSQLSKLSPETAIDISHLSAGLYFLKVDGKMVKIVKE